MKTIQSRASGETVQTAIRMPKKLRDEIKNDANRLGRSINTHVVMTLRDALKTTGADLAGHTPAAESENTA